MTRFKYILPLAVLSILAAQGAQSLGEPELKKARELYVSRGCVGCHQNPELTKAPPLPAVSAKHATNKAALAQIKHSLANGSIGKWGAVEMPPQSHLQDAERDLLARWVLSLHASKEKPPTVGITTPTISVGGIASFDTKPDLSGKAWTQSAFHGSAPASINWSKKTKDLGLQINAGSLAALRSMGGGRLPTDAVTLTVKDVQGTPSQWGQAGLMIASTAQARLLGSAPKYEWIVRTEGGNSGWVYRVRKDVGAGNYELYSSPKIDPAKAVKLEITRNGDNYEFRANGELHYTTGTNSNDTYDVKTKDAMVHFAMTIGGGSAMRARVDDFTIGGGKPAASATPALTTTAATPVAPPMNDLFIERYKGYVIEIVDLPLVYRGYLRGIPSRAIAVGLPNKVSYAFDATACRLVFAWRGGFLDATGAWGGTFGGWYSKPLGEKFYVAPEGFPLRIGDPGKEPKLQFKGYDMDNHLPVFKYMVDGQLVRHRINISDGSSIQHLFSLPGNTKPVYFLAGENGATGFTSADASWKDGRWSVRKEKSSQFSIGAVQ